MTIIEVNFVGYRVTWHGWRRLRDTAHWPASRRPRESHRTAA